MNEILDYLAKAEGDYVHYNKNEKDITLPFGIYKYAHPDAAIVRYIDRLALEIGVVEDSSEWNEDILNRVNEAVDPVQARQLAEEFYTEYLAGAHLELLPSECKVAMMSIYTTSPLIAWKSVQRALVNMQSSGRIDGKLVLSTIDGKYGRKTKAALEAIQVNGYELEDGILLAAMYEYVSLWRGNPIKFGNVLMGWINRVEKLNKLK